MADLIERQAISSWLKQYGQDVLHGKKKLSLMYIWKNLMDLPTAEQQIIKCEDCKWCEARYDTDENAPYWICRNWVGETDADGFCYEAERKTDG